MSLIPISDKRVLADLGYRAPADPSTHAYKVLCQSDVCGIKGASLSILSANPNLLTSLATAPDQFLRYLGLPASIAVKLAAHYVSCSWDFNGKTGSKIDGVMEGSGVTYVDGYVLRNVVGALTSSKMASLFAAGDSPSTYFVKVASRIAAFSPEQGKTAFVLALSTMPLDIIGGILREGLRNGMFGSVDARNVNYSVPMAAIPPNLI
jgi:hypothetical protein